MLQSAKFGLDGVGLAGLVGRALVILATLGVIAFFSRLYQIRMMVRRAHRDYGIPMMPHSFWLGHLVSAAKIFMKYGIPPGHHGQWTFTFIKKEYPEIAEQGLVYLDPWPIGHPIIAVFHPAMMAQFTQEQSLPKWWEQGGRAFKHFTGGEDIVHLEGQEWKQARAIFNPGFSARNLLSLVPGFVEEALVFRKLLQHATETEETVRLETLTTNLTIDVVSRAVLGVRLHTQTQSNRLMSLIYQQLPLLYLQLNLEKQLSPTRLFKHWWLNRTIRRELLPLIRTTARNYERLEGPQTVVALAVRAWVQEFGGDADLTPAFLDRLVKHLKIFMFAGHDTTATTMGFVFYCLARNPDKAAVLCRELDEVLGALRDEDDGGEQVAARIAAEPALLNRLPYATAVIRETLRLFPPVGGTVRMAPPGFMLTHPDTGRRYPAHGFILHSSGCTTGRAPEYWPRPDDFVPERWLPRNDSEKDDSDVRRPLPRDAWRPFEMGPRSCIGQELVFLELRLVLALTTREFVVEERYASDSRKNPWGDHAYQTNDPQHVATAHIKDGLPVVVKKRQWTG